MNRREASKTETRQLILTAARKMFMERKVSECTMRSIAREAGVSPASVVVHFRNKTVLLEEALFEDVEREVLAAKDSMPKEAPLLASFMHIYHHMFRYYDRKRELYRELIKCAVFSPADESPHLNRQMVDFLQFTGGMIEAGKATGTTLAHVDARTAATSLFSMYFYVLANFLRDPDVTVEMATDSLSAMMAQLFDGILAK